MTAYVPGTAETDPKRIIQSLRAIAVAQADDETNIAANAAAVAKLNAVPVFHVSLATQQTTTISTYTKILFDTVDFDTASYWDATNHRYTPKQAGYYRFSWAVYSGASVGAVTTNFSEVRKNTSARNDGSGIFGNGVSTGSALISLNGSTDFVEIFADITAATTAIAGATGFPFLCTFSGEWLRA